MDLDMITLEDNLSYAIIDTLINDNNKYVFLVSEDGNKKGVRKVITKEDGDYLIKLDNDEEFDMIWQNIKINIKEI